MFELWLKWDDGQMVMMYASDNLQKVRDVEYQHAIYGYQTEIRLNKEK